MGVTTCGGWIACLLVLVRPAWWVAGPRVRGADGVRSGAEAV